MEINSSIFFNIARDILPERTLINMIVGTRGTGKTSAAKIEALQHYEKTGKKTVWVRRYTKELDKIIPTFLGGVEQLRNPDGSLAISDLSRYQVQKKSIVDVQGKDKTEVITFIPLTTALYMKSADFSQYDYMVFDEFLIPVGSVRYIKNEVFLFLELINSIVRLRDNFTVFCLANHISNFNPYYDYFNLAVEDNTDKISRPEFTFLFLRNKAYIDEAKKTRLAKAVQGTSYLDYAYGTEVGVKARNIVKAKTGKLTQLCNISHHYKHYTAYYSPMEQAVYISNYGNNTSIPTIYTAVGEGTEGEIYWKSDEASRVVIFLRYYLHHNALYADTNKQGSVTLDLILLLT